MTTKPISIETLSPIAYRVWEKLDGYCKASLKTHGEAVALVSQALLAHRLRVSVGHVRRGLVELRDMEILSSERGHMARNRYYVLVPFARTSNRAPARTTPTLHHYEHLVFTQHHQAAAAEMPLAQDPDGQSPEREDALVSLTDTGLPEVVARPYAEHDAGGLCKLAAAYFAERSTQTDVTFGLLRDMLDNPLAYFTQAKDGAWQPPRDSMIYKNMKAAEVAWNRARVKDRQREAQAVESRERAAKDREAAEAWGALDDGERRAIEEGVARELADRQREEGKARHGAAFRADPEIARGASFKATCRAKAVLFAAARSKLAADQAAAAELETEWSALPETVRRRAEQQAEQYMPLFALNPETRVAACMQFVPYADRVKARMTRGMFRDGEVRA